MRAFLQAFHSCRAPVYFIFVSSSPGRDNLRLAASEQYDVIRSRTSVAQRALCEQAHNLEIP